MKTSVMLSSTDRELFGITIRQETKSQMLSITDLQKAYESARFEHGWNDRNLGMLMKSNSFIERTYHILNERNIIKVSFLTFTELLESQGITKTLKNIGVWKTTGRGDNRQVVADPYIWVLIAMELNPLLYAKVVMWLTDTLIFDRIEAGTEFLPMNKEINKIVSNPNYPEYAKLINQKVFGEHIRGIRNLASSKQLRKIADIEKFIVNAIQMNLIDSEKKLIDAINNYK